MTTGQIRARQYHPSVHEAIVAALNITGLHEPRLARPRSQSVTVRCSSASKRKQFHGTAQTARTAVPRALTYSLALAICKHDYWLQVSMLRVLKP